MNLYDTEVMRLLLAFSIAICATSCVQAQRPFVGIYEVVMFDKGKEVSNDSLPVGQVMFAKLESNGKWQMQNMMSGWDGIWKVAKGKVSLTTTSSPSGKVKKPSVMLFVPSKDGKRLATFKGSAKVLELRRDDRFLEKLAKRYEKTRKQFGLPGKGG